VKLLLVLCLAMLGSWAQRFPDVKDAGQVRIKLERGACRGGCAEYSVEIAGDGTIRYEGRAGVTVVGKHSDGISRAEVAALLEQFREAEFFALKPEYGAKGQGDVARVVLSVTVDGVTRSVADTFGASAGMPFSVGELQQAVDFHGHTTQWVFGDPRTVAALRRDGVDLRSREAGAVLARASALGDPETVRGLIGAGAPLDVAAAPMCGVPLECALRHHSIEVLRMLIAAGASKADQAAKDRALKAALAKDQREAVRMLEAYGAKR
jgi:hypothetical protein